MFLKLLEAVLRTMMRTTKLGIQIVRLGCKELALSKDCIEETKLAIEPRWLTLTIIEGLG